MTVCEKIFRDLKFELPSSRVKNFAVNGALVDDPQAALQTLMDNAPEQETAEAAPIESSWLARYLATGRAWAIVYSLGAVMVVVIYLVS